MHQPHNGTFRTQLLSHSLVVRGPISFHPEVMWPRISSPWEEKVSPSPCVSLCVMGMTLWHHSTEFINDIWMKRSRPVHRTSSWTARWSLSWCTQLTQSCEKPTPAIASSPHQIICLYSKPIYYLFLSFRRQLLQDIGLWLGEKILPVYTNSSLVDFIKKHFSHPPFQ